MKILPSRTRDMTFAVQKFELPDRLKQWHMGAGSLEIPVYILHWMGPEHFNSKGEISIDGLLFLNLVLPPREIFFRPSLSPSDVESANE